MEYVKNQTYIVTIEDIGADGEGIGKIDGYTLFIKDAVIGDVVEAKIMKAKKNYAYAKLEKVLSPSSFRVEPECFCHKQCGGCQLQAMSYEKQLEYKQNKVKNHLVRIGGLEETLVDSVMEPIVGMDYPYRYRNKGQYPVGRNKEGKLITGFYASRTHSVIENTDCKLAVPENKKILEMILYFMERNKISAYDENTGEGLVRHILIRTGFTTKEIMVCFVINGRVLPKKEEIIDELKRIDGMTSISININCANTNVIMGDETITLWGRDTIEDVICRRVVSEDASHTLMAGDGSCVTFQISPRSFYQVNPKQTEKLYSIALDYAGLTGKEIVWDLYCGIGTISLFLAQKAKKVYGVEVIPQAIEDARKNAVYNDITNAEFFVGRAEEVLPEQYKNQGIKADVIVVDPPRKGCDAVCIETMLAMQPERIVYVSCDSSTLARDVKLLCQGGYRLEKCRAVDQFAHTVHVEVVTCLQRVNS